MNLHFDADSETGRPALLLVHGLLSSRLHWLPNLELSQRFRLVRIDLPAHGLSPTPKNADDADPGALAMALDAVREELGIGRWYVCGQSFGAGLTLRYTLDYPDRCSAHVFTNANAALKRQWPQEAREAHQKLLGSIRQGGIEALRRMPYHPAHARRFPAKMRDILISEADRVDPSGFLLLQDNAVPRLPVTDRLNELTVPTLLINGMYERRFQPTRDWLGRTHPAIRIADLDGGHSINIENPEGFNKTLTDFLDEHSG